MAEHREAAEPEGAGRLRHVPGGVGHSASGRTVRIAMAGAVVGDEPEVRVRGDGFPGDDAEAAAQRGRPVS